MTITDNIVSGISRTLRGNIRSVLDWPVRRATSSKRSCIRYAPSAEVILGFGGVLDNGELIHGGAVKLLALRNFFRCNEEEFNILYLVSSAQPPFSEDLVRICRSRGIKFIWNQNGVGYPAWAGAEAETHNAPMRRLRAEADFVIYQSEFCRESAERFLGSCAVASTVLLNPVDLEKFSPCSDALPPRPVKLLAMGTQNYRDRVVSVLECVRDLRADGFDCKLTIAGPLIWRDAESDTRRTLAAFGLDEHVQLLPPFRQEDAPDIYRSHHLLLHPKYMDPCPTVVAEALACGLPVVASRSGGIPEMVDDSCSVLIDVPQSWEKLHTPSGRELARAVAAMVPRLELLSRAARQRAERTFDARRWQENHARILREVLSVS